jgi:hypothetical protein
MEREKIFTREGKVDFRVLFNCLFMSRNFEWLIKIIESCEKDIDGFYLLSQAIKINYLHLMIHSSLNSTAKEEFINNQATTINNIIENYKKLMLFKNNEDGLNLCKISNISDYYKEIYNSKKKSLSKEDYLKDYIMDCYKLLDINYIPEYNIKNKKVDIFIKGKEDILIELKKDNITRKDIYQIYDYKKQYNKNSKGILIGHDVSSDCVELANDLDVTLYKYTIIEKIPSLLYFQPMNEKCQAVEILNSIKYGCFVGNNKDLLNILDNGCCDCEDEFIIQVSESTFKALSY